MEMNIKGFFKKYKDGKFYKQALKLMIPTVLSSLISSLMLMTDTLMISKFMGQSATNGVGISNSLNTVIFQILTAIGMGGGIYIAQFLGAKKYRELKQTAAFSLMLGFFIGIILMIILLFLQNQLIDLLLVSEHQNFDRQTYDYAVNYNSVLLYIWPLNGIILVFFAFMNQTGDTKYTLYLSVVAVLVNTILDLIFINGAGTFPALGVKGAAWASIISVFCELIALIVILIVKKPVYLPNREFWKIDLKLVGKIILTIIPIALATSSLGLSFNFEAAIVNKYGNSVSEIDGKKINDVFSATVATYTIANLFYAVINGYGPVVGYFVGKTLGENDKALAKANASKVMFMGIGLSFILSLFMFTSSFFIIDLAFSKYTVQAKNLARWFLAWQSLSYFLVSIANICFNILRAGNRTNISTIIDIFCTWIFIVGNTWFLYVVVKCPDKYVLLAISLAEIVQTTISYIVYKFVKWDRVIIDDNKEKLIPIENGE